MKCGDGFDTFLIPTPFLNAGDSKDKLLWHYIFNKKYAPDKCLAQSQYCAKSCQVLCSYVHHGTRPRTHAYICATW